MDDNAKNTSAHLVDQELLDARGINMTVEEVSGLSTSKYAARVQSLHLGEDDLVFLKALRRRIKNRLASQNSRRRSVEHLRRLTRELRVVRACRREALSERRALVERRDSVRDKCAFLRRHLLQILHERSDKTEVPSIDIDLASLNGPNLMPRKVSVTETKIPQPDQHISVIVKNDIDTHKLPVIVKNDIDREKLRRELEKEKDIYERVRQELQKEIVIKETVTLPNFATETLIIKEEAPDYDEIMIEEDFENVRQSLLHQISSDERLNYAIEKRNSTSKNYLPERKNSISERNFTSESRNSTSESRNFTSESRNFTPESRNFTSESRNFTPESRNFTSESRNFTSESRNFTSDRNYEESSSDELEMRHYNDIRSESSDRDIFECKIGKLVTQSVNHIYNDKKKVLAKTVFISNEKLSSDIKTMVLSEGQNEVLNLSVKEGRRKSHGRKQSAPRRIAYYDDCDDMVLDLKVKKE